MNGRTVLRVVAVLLLIAAVVGIGGAAYNAGFDAGASAAVEGAGAGAGSGEAAGVPWWRNDGGPGSHGFFASGFHFFFGLLFWALAIFLIIGLLRAAFGGGHGPGGWGGGGRRERMEELHRELHRRDEGGGEQRPAGA